jgi:hypothetical protein
VKVSEAGCTSKSLVLVRDRPRHIKPRPSQLHSTTAWRRKNPNSGESEKICSNLKHTCLDPTLATPELTYLIVSLNNLQKHSWSLKSPADVTFYHEKLVNFSVQFIAMCSPMGHDERRSRNAASHLGAEIPTSPLFLSQGSRNICHAFKLSRS